METGLIPNVKKIVVLRALVLGDLIFILPALESLRRAYPEAEIVYVGHHWTLEFLTGRLQTIDRIVPIREHPRIDPVYGRLIHPEDAEWFFPQMQAEEFDLGFQMQGGGKNSNVMMRDMAPRVAIGTREEGAIALDRWIPHDYYQHDIIRNLELAGLAGAPPVGWAPKLPVLPADLSAANPFIEAIGGAFAVLHTGARDIRRRWDPKQFAKIGIALQRQYSLKIVLTGTAVDQDSAQTVEQAMQGQVINLSSKLSLSVLVGLLSQARLVVSNDTGVLHVALAVGSKAVGLFWSEYISKSLPLSRQNFLELISWNRRCPLCGMFLEKEEVVRSDPRPCMHETSFLYSITPEQVLHAAGRLLELP